MINEEKTSIYELNNVSKIFGEKTIISPLSLNIFKNELVAVIGPSGAGKTTLLNLLGKVIEADSGSILLDGRDVRTYKSVKKYAKKVGIIHQQYDLVDRLKVIDNVLVGRMNEWNLGKSLLSLLITQDKNIAYKALDRLGIKDLAYEMTEKLSGGEKQRVAIARLLVQDPEIILADEPVSALDPARAIDILDQLTNISKSDGKSLVAILHSVEYARKYFDRIIGLKEGSLIFDKKAGSVTDDDINNLFEIKGNLVNE